MIAINQLFWVTATYFTCTMHVRSEVQFASNPFEYEGGVYVLMYDEEDGKLYNEATQICRDLSIPTVGENTTIQYELTDDGSGPWILAKVPIDDSLPTDFLSSRVKEGVDVSVISQKVLIGIAEDQSNIFRADLDNSIQDKISDPSVDSDEGLYLDVQGGGQLPVSGQVKIADILAYEFNSWLCQLSLRWEVISLALEDGSYQLYQALLPPLNAEAVFRGIGTETEVGFQGINAPVICADEDSSSLFGSQTTVAATVEDVGLLGSQLTDIIPEGMSLWLENTAEGGCQWVESDGTTDSSDDDCDIGDSNDGGLTDTRPGILCRAPIKVNTVNQESFEIDGVDYIVRYAEDDGTQAQNPARRLLQTTNNVAWMTAQGDCKTLTFDGSSEWMLARVQSEDERTQVVQRGDEMFPAWIGIQEETVDGQLRACIGNEAVMFNKFDPAATVDVTVDGIQTCVTLKQNKYWQGFDCADSTSVSSWICQRVDQRSHMEIGDADTVTKDVQDWDVVQPQCVEEASQLVFNTSGDSCSHLLSDEMDQWCFANGKPHTSDGLLLNHWFHPYQFHNWLEETDTPEENTLLYFGFDRELSYHGTQQRTVLWLFQESVDVDYNGKLNNSVSGALGMKTALDLGLVILTKGDSLRQVLLVGWFNDQITFIDQESGTSALCPETNEVGFFQDPVRQQTVCIRASNDARSYYSAHYGEHSAYLVEGVIHLNRAIGRLLGRDVTTFDEVPCYNSLLTTAITAGSDSMGQVITDEDAKTVLNSGTPSDLIIDVGGICASKIGLICKYDQTGKVLATLRNRGLRELNFELTAFANYSSVHKTGVVAENVAEFNVPLFDYLYGMTYVNLTVKWQVKDAPMSSPHFDEETLRVQNVSDYYCDLTPGPTYSPTPSPTDPDLETERCEDDHYYLQKINRAKRCVVENYKDPECTVVEGY